jgi:hypothetical protein
MSNDLTIATAVGWGEETETYQDSFLLSFFSLTSAGGWIAVILVHWRTGFQP